MLKQKWKVYLFIEYCILSVTYCILQFKRDVGKLFEILCIAVITISTYNQTILKCKLFFFQQKIIQAVIILVFSVT